MNGKKKSPAVPPSGPNRKPTPEAAAPCLGRYLAMAGAASRRRSVELVKAGRVAVDGVLTTDPARRIGAGEVVALDGRPVSPAALVTVMLHKPPGWVCTVSDRHAERTVVELVSMPGVRLYPAGRLDQDSEGLLILTNDGDYALRLTHPRHGVRKTYEVRTLRPLTPDARNHLLEGVTDEGELLRAEAILPLDGNSSRFLLGEGRKREIRRMVRAVGNRVQRLQRMAVGELVLGDLPSGQWRLLTPAEMALSLRPGPPRGWFPPPRPTEKPHVPTRTQAPAARPHSRTSQPPRR
jgi:23S rRNA pseudouridine2605 synthase